MKPNKYRLKTLSAVAIAAAVSFGSNAQIAENPIIIPEPAVTDMYAKFILDEFDFENTSTFCVTSSGMHYAPGYATDPSWEYTLQIFDENLTPVRSRTIELKSVRNGSNYEGTPRYEYLFPLIFELNSNTGVENIQIFTKTLFNTDDKLEYMTLDEDQHFIPEGKSVVYYRGTKVLSEDGTVLNRLTFPEGYYTNSGLQPDICMSGSTIFIRFVVEKENSDTRAHLFYRIDKEAGSVNFVTAMPSKMSVRSGDGVVTVDLPADADYSAVELVDMSGRVMGGVPVSGDRVSVDTSRLARGTYVLRAAGASGSECAKIVVR